MISILVTGGAGFIGSCFALKSLDIGFKTIVLDKLTYAGNLDNLSDVEKHKRFKFIKGDIGDKDLVTKVLFENDVDYVVNFAAESHVDNSIENPSNFIETNVVGTYSLLQASLNHWKTNCKKKNFKFLHVSTDEVFGSLKIGEPSFYEQSNYRPNSPYSASKAASDHLVRAWNKTYGLPTIITNCSNNFGPRQHKEKLIPKTILMALNEKSIPVYGNGKNIRDWIFVEDHVDGIMKALEKGEVGEEYCLGGDYELTNIELVNKICYMLDNLYPRTGNKKYRELVSFVADRVGHDFRYAINSQKAKRDLGFLIKNTFDLKLESTIKWYLQILGKE